ncbi:MAG: integral rane protein [Streptosporangiaceae bacterium]|nr:integral rane protein [Streptosporangiaceae bacterium]
MLFVLGLVGFVLRRYGLPVVPVIIGVILGPRAEQQMRRAFQLSDGDVAGLFDTPFSITVYAVVAVVLLWPLVHRLVRRRPPAGEVADRAEGELDSHSGEERHGDR